LLFWSATASVATEAVGAGRLDETDGVGRRRHELPQVFVFREGLGSRAAAGHGEAAPVMVESAGAHVAVVHAVVGQQKGTAKTPLMRAVRESICPLIGPRRAKL